MLVAARAEDFYWIVEEGGQREIALWMDGSWWLAGSEDACLDADLIVISDVLKLPSGQGFSSTEN